MGKIVATLALASAFIFCGKKSDSSGSVSKGPAGACHFVKDKYCNEYYGLADRKWVDENNCKVMNVPVLDKCPTEGAVKRCVFDGGTGQERHVLIYDAKADFYCKQPGVIEKAP